MRPHHLSFKKPNYEYGAALPIAFIFLLVISTALGLQFQRNALLTKINHTVSDKQEAFYNAEVGIKLAEEIIASALSPDIVQDSLIQANIHYITSGSLDYQAFDFWADITFCDVFPLAQVIVEPYYDEIDFLNLSKPSSQEFIRHYKITARGLSANNIRMMHEIGLSALSPDVLSESIIQTFYKKQHFN